MTRAPKRVGHRLTKRVAPAHGPNPGFLFPVARSARIAASPSHRRGLRGLRGEIVLADDFDELPAEFVEHFR